MKTMEKTNSVTSGLPKKSVFKFLSDWGGTIFGLALAAVLLGFLLNYN